MMVPALRFPGFEGEWESKQGDEIFLSRRTKGREGLPMYSVTLTRGMIPRDALERNIGEDAEDNLNLFVAKGDIVYNMMRMWQGAFGLATVDCMVSGAYVVLEPKAGVDSKFFVYNFGRQIALYFFTSYSYGLTSDRLRLYSKDFAQIKFAVPTFPEQTKIASFLSAVDEKLRALKQKKAALEVYKKGVMQQLFSRELRFKDVDGEDFPDWEETIVEKNAVVSAGATPNTSKREYWGGSIRWMNSGELNQKRVYEVENRITLAGLKSSSTKLLPKNCVLIGLAGQGKTRGTVAINLVELCTNQSIAAILPNPERFIAEFLYHNLDFRYDELRSLSKGDGGRGGLNLNIIRSIKIELPSLSEQTKIAEFLSSLDTKIQATQQQIEQVEVWKKGLLQKMFV